MAGRGFAIMFLRLNPEAMVVNGYDGLVAEKHSGFTTGHADRISGMMIDLKHGKHLQAGSDIVQRTTRCTGHIIHQRYRTCK